ncbi:diacylglycerol/lipid kinase family protein [Paenibacillus spongiae]|uniref:Diacylglycerol kinase family lipid kinase n=1 Tax=Paenibacillus spongiae TaxID=2909671 RepID=A0ABY5SA68_9BACL|nr:diacylglycerol kinase family protein [Paenibacillus spongiae]UVI30846.1 diacylglycerol kinase family lipid kinase [Paenibacillus spongiae]
MWIFAVNEQAGGGRGRAVWRKVEADVKRRGIPYLALLTSCPEQASSRIREELALHPAGGINGIKGVIVVGGDGTLHGLLPVLANSGVPLGIIPAGSGNDTARALGLSKQPIQALERALSSAARPVDLLLFTGCLPSTTAPGPNAAEPRPILTALAIGFDAAVADAVNRSSYKKLCNLLRVGSLAYIIGVFQTLLTYRPQKLQLTVDGKEHAFERGWLSAVCNTSSYGGGLRICPEASSTDGLLDVCVVHSCTPLQLLRLFPTLLSGSHIRLPYVTLLRGRSVTVAADGPARTRVFGDGETLGAVPLTAQSAPGKLLLLY